MTSAQIKAFIGQVKQNLPQTQIQLNQPLSQFTSLHLGGRAKLLIESKRLEELVSISRLALKSGLPVLVLGDGTNVLISDKGFDGLVIVNKIQEIKIVKQTKKQLKIRATSGTPLNLLVSFSLKHGFGDLAEFVSIPGRLGGAVWNNAHSHQKLIGDYIDKVTALNQKGDLTTYNHDQLEFAYDFSRFQRFQEVIIQVWFSLNSPLAAGKTEAEAVKPFINYRVKSQPQGLYSSGCVFKNIDPKIQAKLKLSTPSTGYIIDKLLKLKGYRIGGAWVDSIHANFLVHQGQATATDFYQLINFIQAQAKQKLGIDLKTEIKLIGFN